MNFTLFILGCQYNYYDAHSIAHLMTKMGYVYVGNEQEADVIIVLSCSVRQKPMDRIFGKLKNWKKLPKKPKIIITACLLPKDRKKLSNKVYAILDTDKFEGEIVKLLKCQIDINNNITIEQYNNFIPRDAQPNTAYIPIMQGCDNFCSYCVVPYTRGREISRTIDEIIRDIKKEVKSGKKHIMLLGQNVNSFGSNFKIQSSKSKNIRDAQHFGKNQRNSAFVGLLQIIDNLPNKFDYNFMSANPQDFSEELINFLAKAKKWNRQLHLPLQSGNDEILHKMNRRYTASQYLSIIENCKLKIDNLFISTDIIVGFPGESKKQFQDTITLCKKIGFDKAYISQYSPRPGTPAAKLKDNVSTIEKKRRWLILNNLINKN